MHCNDFLETCALTLCRWKSPLIEQKVAKNFKGVLFNGTENFLISIFYEVQILNSSVTLEWITWISWSIFIAIFIFGIKIKISTMFILPLKLDCLCVTFFLQNLPLLSILCVSMLGCYCSRWWWCWWWGGRWWWFGGDTYDDDDVGGEYDDDDDDGGDDEDDDAGADDDDEDGVDGDAYEDDEDWFYLVKRSRESGDRRWKATLTEPADSKWKYFIFIGWDICWLRKFLLAEFNNIH